MAAIDLAPYSHSPTHKAVLTKDYANLEKIIAGLPRLSDPSKIHTESASIADEAIADAISSVIDRRDVPNRDTPLHLAVKLGDTAATETLMLAGADWSLQNEHGWSALQEAICNHQEHIAKIIIKHYQPTVWAKWCRRLPRLLQTMRRMRDFYMEISFEFESSVVPFISRIAPSDTYKIWKRGANLRADMTLAGFDGFKIQRADQTVLFLGDGDGSEKAPPGSLYMISHKHKEVMNALDGAGAAASDGEVEQEIQAMSQTMFRPGVDVTNAVLSPQMTWRRHEKSEVVGIWRAKVYDMQNVVVSIKSRKVQGSKSENEEINDILTDEEDKQLQSAINNGIIERREIPIENGVDYKHKYEKSKSKSKSKSIQRKGDEQPSTSQSPGRLKDGSHESEYKKGLRPILWLSPDFPLHTNELLPLLDILANKVKAIRRLRELLTTKLPAGTFPVKVAIPVVPTIRVLVTFTKFEELQPLDEFLTPPTSPIDADGNLPTPSSSSWFQWIKTPYQNASSSTSRSSPCTEHGNDPFVIPADYTWITAEEKKKKMTEKSKLKKGKTQNQ